ncbi:MAG TPA: methyltransferase domain-containing protein, partial [Phototrophicaceae bacterium]|nr:methyltransferase domain-containing protein [Phototrophicaceae bacterium]
IILKLHHQGYRIHEVAIPTYYGDEVCYVNGMKYAKDVVRAVFRYHLTISGRQTYPEFAEYAAHSNLDYFQRLLGENERVLDVGSGEGHFAAALADKRNNRITGMDSLTQPKRRDAFDTYFCGDLNQGLQGMIEQTGEHVFDKILLQNVLEHLYQPERVLDDCHHVLKPTGRVIVSVPNVANITVRMALLFGRFNYVERGILDKTHLRFFTRSSARQLLEMHGYRIIRQEVTNVPFEIVLGLRADALPVKLLNYIVARLTHLLPGLLGYQLIFVASSDRVAQIERYRIELPINRQADVVRQD